jgi:catechol 2,3-dioxygenase
MALPETNHAAPFNVTRLSHVSLRVRDLAASRCFYEEIIGLVVTSQVDETLYLRGVEETCHHSLVLRRDSGTPTADRVGFRVRDEEELERAFAYFQDSGRKAVFVDAPYQGRTLHVVDDGNVPLELCAHMPTEPRQIIKFDEHRGAPATRIDHIQVHVADLPAAASFYGELGFRVSEFASEDGTPNTPFRSIFLARKGNANDIVLLSNLGPRLHHFAFVVNDATSTLVRVCDLVASKGLRNRIEWGPNRHGLGYEQFLYLNDPDGYRVELLGPPYQFIDLEEEPLGWSTESDDVRSLWGPPPPDSWFTTAAHFGEVEPQLPAPLAATPAEDGRTPVSR